MPTGFWVHICEVLLGFKAYLNTLAKRMNLTRVSRMLETYPAAGNILKADERSNFPNVYPGTLPPDGSEGVFIDDLGVSYNIKSLIATRRSMEYLWHYYQSQDMDPVPSRKDLSVDQVGPFMRSNVYDLGDFEHDGNPDHNYDGDTTFFAYHAPNPDDP
jgi:hypothetical protein